MYFTDIVQFGAASFEVSFTLIFTTRGKKFFVTIRKEGKIYFVDMVNREGKWVIKEKRAAWIMDIEGKLSEVIIKNSAPTSI